MIRVKDNYFEINTNETTYAFYANELGLLEHLHYGARISDGENEDERFEEIVRALKQKVSHGKGTTVCYQKGAFTVAEDMPSEVSSLGKGDFKEPAVIITYADGSQTSDFIYESYEVKKGKDEMKGLPISLPGKNTMQLKVVLKDRFKPVKLVLIYSAFEGCNVITRRSVVINEGEEPIKVNRLMSTQIDLDGTDYKLVTFGGNWAREMHKNETKVEHGIYVNRSLAGVSSNRSNPFVMLTKDSTGEESGEGYGINLVYSGNHYEALEAASFDNSRFVCGIDPTQFTWTLNKGEEFESPEAVMTFSDKGYRGISAHMHEFVRNHIVRGNFKNKPRPVLINSWEANYFKITEHNLISLAKEAKNLGMELFVMDDGWFKGRNDDTSSLGDWEVDTKKLPGGINAISEKIHDIGLDFGIWVEPEMINENSDLYRNHPEYAMLIPGRDHSEGRNQMILDLTNPDVVAYVKDAMYKVLSAGKIDYVKWDMNRMFSDVYSGVLDASRQQETAHRYILGLYDIAKYLTESFPDVLFEGCASGGNRFDLGMLTFMPQIWASDDTDAMERTIIQTGYSYGYPMSVLTSHVSSCPNHQTLRNTPLETRFNVAAFGLLGYELNLCELSSEEKEKVRIQVELYKKYRDVLQGGDFYRVSDHQWTVVSKDKKRAVAMQWGEMVSPNHFYAKLRTVGLDDKKVYHVYNIGTKYNLKEFGDLVNQVAPFHVKKDSLVHNTLAKFIKIDSEVEDYTVPGILLNNAGIRLCQAFGGTGLDDKTRVFQDFASRLYFIEEAEKSDIE